MKDTHEASITIIEYDLIKQNESSLGVMKWDSQLLVSWNDYNRNLRSEVGRLEIRVEEHFLRRLNYAKVVIKVFRSLKVSSPSLSNTKTADIPVFRLGPVPWPSGEPQVTHRLSLGILGFSRRTDPPLLSSIMFFIRMSVLSPLIKWI